MAQSDDFIETIRDLNLSSLFLSLTPSDKQLVREYSRNMVPSPEESRRHDITNCHLKPGLYRPKDPAEFLLVVAANLIPFRHFRLAAELLERGLDLAVSSQQTARIHANLAQLYYDQISETNDALANCREHCRQVVETGSLTGWAGQMLASLPSESGAIE